jgi:hypothetical protein
MSDLAAARVLLDTLAAQRRTHGQPVTADQLDRAAALLVDLWTAAARHGITPDHWGYTLHLPRAALDTISAPRPKAKRSHSGGRTRHQRR